ncbi:MAG TPA: carbohydrate-binding family 9-like protein [Pyrinomonadaceae bacterium]|jgi:hypothetical protein|nr:carbohydrate-binding family 9-like protein [Pyrinomonadaceae bacterium]
MVSDEEERDVFEAARAAGAVAAGDFASAEWARARAAPVARYWSGEEAPPARRAEARALWDEVGLTVRFDCRQGEPFVVSAEPVTGRKTIGLWDRDVCELFITPESGDIRSYYEFEAAPTGEWLDLLLRVGPGGRETDWDFRSGMTAAAEHDAGGSYRVGLRVPWTAFGRRPRAGERWRCNLFRCVGSDPGRGYLAWRPTHTPQPAFHVPERFGWIEFK